MTTETTTDTETTEAVQPPQAAEVDAETPDMAQPETDWKKAARHHERAASTAQRDLDAARSELEAASARIAELERAALVATIARESGLPDHLADRLRGETEDELRADAEVLRGPARKPKPPTTDNGPRGFSATPTSSDPLRDLLRQR